MKQILISSLFAGAVLLAANPVYAKPIDYGTTPKDIAIANKDSIVYWLTKRGELSANASEHEKRLAFEQYVTKAAKIATILPPVVAKQYNELQRNFEQKSAKHLHKNAANKTVKILTVLIDFPDLKYNNNGLTSSDTPMYYSDYNIAHYKDLMFSQTGYAGPSGQNLISGYQYYQAESGGTFSFTGEVYNWVTADNNAAHYGGNDTNNNDRDKDPVALIKEAVTKAVQANNINLADYDIEDPYDLDGDGNVDEPDGLIDHVSVFHSSMGEEAGGGKLGDDAIWSHRFFVDGQQGGYTIPGTNKKLFGYVIQPIDAAAGVVVHEFGHDLGLPDLYDLNGNRSDNTAGSPVGRWSVMSGGSWVGSIPGTEPSSFSPYGRAFLQATYGGNWVSEQTYTLEQVTAGINNIDLVHAANHTGLNQIKVELPEPLIEFTKPYTGSYQYYSDQGHLMTNSLQFEQSLPNSTDLKLSMKAHWDIELDYDYVQVLVNDTAIAGNHTKVNNQYHASVKNFITDKSKNITGAEGTLGWLDLNFDLTAYAGQSVTIKIQYVTDPNTGGYGFVADDIQILDKSTNIYSDGAEAANSVQLNGFLRVTNQKPGKSQHYWLQLRSFTEQDAGLNSSNYSPGVLVWFGDSNTPDNNSSEHPGKGLVGVVDADQGEIKNGANMVSTSSLIRDAAFSLYGQRASNGDNDLTPKSVFNDTDDYSFSAQPESGVVLPKHGFKIEILNQATSSETATLKISSVPLVLTAAFASEIDFRTVSFSNNTAGGAPAYSYAWDFGDGSSSTEASPVHTYATSGNYQVTLTVTDADSTVSNTQKFISIAEQLAVGISETINGASVSATANVTGGVADFSYVWDFGDGTTVSTSQADHTYPKSGQYTLSLTVTSADKQKATTTKAVNVVVPLEAAFTSSRTNLTVTFNSQISGGDGSYSYAWDFGDGSSSTQANPNHSYSSAGTYTVELEVTDGTGVKKTTSQSITVSEPPPPPSPPSSGGGGGSFGLFGILLLGLFGIRRKK